MIETMISDGICVLRLHSPPLNTLSFELLQRLGEAVDEANANPAVQAIVIAGDAAHFSAGADVKLFHQIRTREDAVHVSQVFQTAFQKLEDSAKPTIAALTGTIVGGALELAMACHGRVAAANCRFRMPEVNLAINPGAGGTQRLPRLVGVEAALRMLLRGETVDASQALEMGLVDAVDEPDRLLDQACRFASEQSPIATTARRPASSDDGSAFAVGEELVAKVRPEIVAPRKILEAVRIAATGSLNEGLHFEQTAFADCMETLPAQNKIYLFFATSDTSKLPELADVEAGRIERAAVIGMGTMGTGIVHALIQSGVPVVAMDQEADVLNRGVERIRKSLRKRVERGRMTEAEADTTLARITTTTGWEELAQMDLVIESVFEDLEVKRSVLERVESLCGPETIIASNTSTLSLDDLASGLQRPERLVGLHFFNPAQRMPLVEVIRRQETPAAIVATMLKFAKRLRKTPVVVANREGFLVNRVFVPYLQEAFSLIEEGADPAAVDAAAVQFGFPMGPLVLIDMAGLDILVHAQRVLDQAFPHHGPLSPVAIRLDEGGHWGQKSGIGVYRYEAGDFTPHASPETERIIDDVRREKGIAPRDIGADEITDRLVLRMAAEAAWVMEEGIVARESDVDAAMVLGTGFPDFRGGILKYAKDVGLDQITARLEQLTKQCGDRFTPCRRLRDQKGVV